MIKCQTDDFVVPPEVMEGKMNWPPDEHRCHIPQHSKRCHIEPFEHCQECHHCLTRILQSVFLTHVELCKERHVLEAL